MKLNELLGTEFPFIQGGMANIATGEFAAAVSNAGALGLIGAGGMTPDSLRENIRRCRELTDRPFGVNVMLMHPRVEEMVRVVAEERVMVGNSQCFGHVQCDSIIMGAAHIQSVPAITANCPDAQLIHEAAIGKIAGDQLLKLETLGLTPEEAEETILKGFLA